MKAVLLAGIATVFYQCTGSIGPSSDAEKQTHQASAEGGDESADAGASDGIYPDDSIAKAASVAKFNASRVSGVAPLSVFFDATGSTGPLRPFHALQYAWDFGDTSAGTWALTGHAKNAATGGVAAHVFDKAGTYQVKLTVRDASGVTATAQVTINVQDPNVVFASNTYCFANGSDFTGCPTGAKRITTSNTASIANSVASGRRLLLRRGDRFTANAPIELDKPGQGILGAFGACTSPDARGICSNAPLIASTDSQMTAVTVSGDTRLMDLKITGPTGDSDSLGVGLGGIGALAYRIRTRGFQTGVLSAFYLVQSDQLAVVDSDIGQANSNQSYIGSERLMLLGNHLHDSFTSHVLRVWHAYKAAISENLIENASIGGENGRHALKLHGLADPSDTSGQSSLSEGTNAYGAPLSATRFVHISDNTFGASPPWPVSIGPQFDGVDERVSDVVFERNFWRTSGTVYPGAQPLDTPIHCAATRDITVRNNIFDGSGGGEDYTAIDISRYDVSPPTVSNVQVLNNLVYRRDRVGTTIVMVRISAGVQSTVVRNNLGVATAYAQSGRIAVVNGGTSTVKSNNSFISNPNFVVSPPITPLDFRPGAGAGSIDLGFSGVTIDDFVRRMRTGTPDLGPFEYVAN